MNRSDRTFGPWSTALDSELRLELSAYWRRRMRAIGILPRVERRIARGALAAAMVAAILIAAAPLVAVAPASAADGDEQSAAAPREGSLFVARFSNGVEIELIGASTAPSLGQPWWRPDGEPLLEPPYKPLNSVLNVWNSPCLREICWRWRGVEDPEIQTSWSVEEQNNGWGPVQPADADGNLRKDLTAYAVPFSNLEQTCTLRFTVNYPASKWQDYWQGQGGHVSSYVSHPPGREPTGVTFDKPRSVGGGAFVVMTYKLALDEDARLIAVDGAGRRHVGDCEPGGNIMGFRQLAVHFPKLQPPDIRTWIVQRRTRATETVLFRNVSLDPTTPSLVQIVNLAQQPTSPARPSDFNATSYGPIVDAVLNGNVTHDSIDFETGRIAKVNVGASYEETLKQLVEDGIDAAGAPFGLMGFDLVVVPAETKHWDQGVDQLREHLKGARSDPTAQLDGRGQLPATYFFETREGARGLLQITDLIPNESVKIRYKLAE